MKIEHKVPPNYDVVRKYFPKADFHKGTVFTYGDTCYCKDVLPPDLFVHEETHAIQQKNPKKWWKKYIKNPQFRLEQELEAYQNQWNWIKRSVKDRNLRFRMRDYILRDLSGGLYGNMISFGDAEKLFPL